MKLLWGGEGSLYLYCMDMCSFLTYINLGTDVKTHNDTTTRAWITSLESTTETPPTLPAENTPGWDYPSVLMMNVRHEVAILII